MTVEAEGAEFETSTALYNRRSPKNQTRHGRRFTAVLRRCSIESDTPLHFLFTNTHTHYITACQSVEVKINGRPAGKQPMLETTGAEAEYLRIIVPSAVECGKDFMLRIVSFDKWDNCSSSCFRGKTLRRARSGENGGTEAVKNIDFTGSYCLPVSISEEGIYRYSMDDVISNAVRVSEKIRGPYWGDIHIHSGLSSDGQGPDPFPYARDVSGLDFAAVTDHIEGMGKTGVEENIRRSNSARKPGSFAVLFSHEHDHPQWSTEDFNNVGHYNIYCHDEETYRGYAEPREGELWPDIFKAERPGPEQYHGIFWDRDRLSGTELRPAVEIYSHHGQSEIYDPQHILSYEFNRMRNPERRANTSMPGPHYCRDYWKAGARFGVFGSSDEHTGQGGRRHGGIAAVYAEKLDRREIYDALKDRACYATTGERILLDFSVNGTPHGGEICCGDGGPLAIGLSVWGTAVLLRVEILRFRFGKDEDFIPAYTAFPKPETMDFTIKLEEEFSGPCMYYARITQEPLEWPGMAWSSPVWIDRGE